MNEKLSEPYVCPLPLILLESCTGEFYLLLW